VVSEKKLAANRSNAQHSTGPKTELGKEKSKRNAFKHGFFARHLLSAVEPATLEWQEIQDLHEAFRDHYQPVGPIEELLVEKILSESVRFSRFLAREQQATMVRSDYYPLNVNRFVRYQSAINRQLFQAITELERQQSKREEVSRSDEPCNSEPPDAASNTVGPASEAASDVFTEEPSEGLA
jgi:hypothetical protein